MPPVRVKPHQGPLHGGAEEPGTAGSSPSTLTPDYLGMADARPKADENPAITSLKKLVRGVY